MTAGCPAILPVAWRAPLAALSGALLAVGPPAVLLGPMLLDTVDSGWGCRRTQYGMCSLLSHDYWPQPSVMKD